MQRHEAKLIDVRTKSQVLVRVLGWKKDRREFMKATEGKAG